MPTRPEKILHKIKKKFKAPQWINSDRTPFQTLVATIISQNTAQRNTSRAFKRLSDNFSITPEDLAKAKKERIEQSLKVAGLYRNKARVIKEVSSMLVENFQGDLAPIFSLPLEEARKTLMQFPGIGPKTADVLLLFSVGKPTIPVDTHVNRVSKRLGLVPEKAKYEEIRKSLQALYSSKDYLDIHVLLIQLGRKYCKARKTLCHQCPVSVHCPSSTATKKAM